MVYVVAEIEVRDDAREEFLKEFRRVVPIVRDEDGCIEYGPAIDMASEVAQPPRGNIVTVIEKWSTEAALRAHYKAPHMVEYRKRAAPLMVGVTIRVFTPA